MFQYFRLHLSTNLQKFDDKYDLDLVYNVDEMGKFLETLTM